MPDSPPPPLPASGSSGSVASSDASHTPDSSLHGGTNFACYAASNIDHAVKLATQIRQREAERARERDHEEEQQRRNKQQRIDEVLQQVSSSDIGFLLEYL